MVPVLRESASAGRPPRPILWSRAVREFPWSSQLLLVPAALMMSVVVGAGVARDPKYMVAFAVAIGVGLLLVHRRGNGWLLAVALALGVPYWTTFGSAQLDGERLVLVAAGAGLVAGGWRSRLSGVDLAVIGLAVLDIASWSSSRADGVPYGLLIASLIPLALYVVTRVSVSWASIDRLLKVLLFFSTVGALTVLYEYFVARHVIFVPVADPTVSPYNGGLGRIFRPGGVFGGAPTASVVLAATLLASLPLAIRERGRTRLICVGAMGVILVAVALTLSRSGWTGLGAGALAFLWWAPWRARWWIELVGVIAVLATVALWAVPSAATQSTGFQEALVRSENTTGRFQLWSVAPGLIADSTSHLVFGRGFDVFFSTARIDPQLAATPLIFEGGPHNDYIRALLEEGVVGLLLFCGWTFGAMLVGYRRLRTLPARTPERIVLAAFTGAVLSLSVSSLTHDFAHGVPVIVVSGIITGVLVTLAKGFDPSPASGPAVRGGSSAD